MSTTVIASLLGLKLGAVGGLITNGADGNEWREYLGESIPVVGAFAVDASQRLPYTAAAVAAFLFILATDIKL